VLTFWNKGAILPSYGCCSSFILDSRDHLKYSLNVCKPRVFVLYNIVISGPISIMYKRILDSSHSYWWCILYTVVGKKEPLQFVF